VIERRVAEPMFRLPLFRIRAFTFGTLSTFLAAVSRGGLMFMLIIWLQGIWRPLHGYGFTETPLWAGINMLPLTIGLLLAGPTSGYLSDRFGARPFATGGMIAAAISFALLMALPIDFAYPVFAAILLLQGISMGMFASPNRAAVMNSLPAADRGAGGGMNQTFQNSAQVLSVQHLVGPHALAALPAHAHAALTGQAFFPRLIAGPFSDGLDTAFTFAIVACLIAAASLLRGGQYHHAEEPAQAPIGPRPPFSVSETEKRGAPSPATGGSTCALSGTDSPPSPPRLSLYAQPTAKGVGFERR